MQVAILIIVAGLMAACETPCRTLAEVVCACNDNRSVEQSCLAEVTLAAETNPASEDAEVFCSERLDSCSCDALARGHFEACGLAEAPHSL